MHICFTLIVFIRAQTEMPDFKHPQPTFCGKLYNLVNHNKNVLLSPIHEYVNGVALLVERKNSFRYSLIWYWDCNSFGSNWFGSWPAKKYSTIEATRFAAGLTGGCAGAPRNQFSLSPFPVFFFLNIHFYADSSEF